LRHLYVERLCECGKFSKSFLTFQGFCNSDSLTMTHERLVAFAGIDGCVQETSEIECVFCAHTPTEWVSVVCFWRLMVFGVCSSDDIQVITRDAPSSSLVGCVQEWDQIACD
jgi:hypothetical protein